MMEVHLLSFGEGCKVSVADVTQFFDISEGLPLRIGSKESPCALHHIEGGLLQTGTVEHTAAHLDALGAHGLHCEVTQALAVGKGTVA